MKLVSNAVRWRVMSIDWMDGHAGGRVNVKTKLGEYAAVAFGGIGVDVATVVGFSTRNHSDSRLHRT